MGLSCGEELAIYGTPFVLILLGILAGLGEIGVVASFDPGKNPAPLILFIIAAIWICILVLLCTSIFIPTDEEEKRYANKTSNTKNNTSNTGDRKYRNFIDQEI